ncbi:MAG: cytochrome b N-terminal domain-containing protein [Elusimicrobia bacterium]|nr:cytochrome b N-terminal domain-containing protein [Elusimicrobiota bacterium]
MIAWVHERTGLDRVWKALFERHVPEARGPAAWLYTLGSASLFVFLVQALTGALLAMSYAPTPDHAYDSVRYITGQVALGGFIRGLHHWGASFMVVLAVLHMLRVYFMGAYKYPREITWMTGVCLLLLVMGFSFTGDLLPWDQKAYWATAVGTNIAGQTPVIGGVVSRVLKGGSEMGAATLTRFYAFHVLVLPALLAMVVLVHLFLVVWHGISELPERRLQDGDPQGP